MANGADRATVLAAMSVIDRRGFLPARARRRAAEDRPLGIGHGQTNSQPHTVVDLLVALDVAAGQRVLDVGSGSAWTTALLAHLVGPTGSVLGVERVAALATWGRENLARFDLLWARIERSRPGALGWPDEAPFDRILVSASASLRVPPPLLDQLGAPGVLVAPVDDRLVQVHRAVDGTVEERTLGRYRFVPLIVDR